MPRKAKELSALEVSRIKNVGMNAVGGVPGLFLRIGLSDARSWVLRITLPSGKRADMGLGGADKVTLAQAREAAREAHAKVRSGIDPIAERDAARPKTVRRRGEPEAGVVTFKVAAEKVYEIKRAEWSPVHAKNWWSSVERLAFPFIGATPVAEVDTADVLKVLNPIWKTNTKTAVVLRARIEAVVGWSMTAGHRPEGLNPARWQNHLSNLLPKPGKVAKTKHFAALPYKQAPEVYQALALDPRPAAAALRFLILATARSSEVRLMTWDEVDFDAAVWSLSPERTKNGLGHRVPLVPEAMALLEAAAPEEKRTGHVWLGPVSGRAITDITLGEPMRALGLERETATVHGWRSTVRDYVAETRREDHIIIEHQLQHRAGRDSTVAAYYRTDHLEDRRVLLQAWADFLKTPPKKSAAS